MVGSRLTLLASTLLALGSAVGPAHAKSWCAYPLWVHEWGVLVFDGAGKPKPGGGLPAWFHTAGQGREPRTPVRDLPRDSGERDLPVVHFYSPGGGDVSVGLEVGFTRGEATAWFPQVDVLQRATDANSPRALVQRTTLLSARQARQARAAAVARSLATTTSPLPPDPTRQLIWERLDLSPSPSGAPARTDVAWIAGARSLEHALWVSSRAEHERFVFYEGRTRESTPLTLSRAPEDSAGRRSLVLQNIGTTPVFDVTLVHHERSRSFLVQVSRLDAGARTTFLLEAHAVASPREARTRAEAYARAAWVDPASPAPDMRWSWDLDTCVMMRDPALPEESARDHRLYRNEVDLLLQTWGDRLFAGEGTTLSYREDVAALDAAMPLSVYTDMRHFPLIHRLGLAVIEHLTLP